jgi:hypothetical protein
MVLTLFSIPKPFVGHIGTIQRNAIGSWLQLRPRPEVILLGNDEGTAELAAKLGVRHLPKVERNSHGTPLVSSLFATANDAATHEMLCYVNADIVLLSDFAAMTARIGRARCLVVGKRTNLEVSEEIEFSESNWEKDLRDKVRQYGSLNSRTGMDYFLFPRGLWRDLPPFAIGRLMWDNWLIYDARRRRLPVVDATRIVTAIHQNHGYSIQMKATHGGWNWEHPETKRNLELAGGHENSYNIDDCTHVLFHSGIWPAFGSAYLQQRLKRPPFKPWAPSLRAHLMRAAISGGLRGHGLLNRLRRATN